MKVIALVPAHNEEIGIERAICSLQEQTRVPDRIIVITDNCTDKTGEIASELDCEVWATKNNKNKKAGALNQVLSCLLVSLDDEDVILVQDADSFLDQKFIETGLSAYTDGIGGVGGVFRGRVESRKRFNRWVEAFQANEYARYELDIRRQKGKVLVLTGTATLLRVSILREVVLARRNGVLPYGSGQVYDIKVLTEDNELSFALMSLGYTIKSPRGCTLSTETMPTLRQLAQQRLRWKRGALENLFDYGWTRVTRQYWLRQLLSAMGLVVTTIYLGTLAYALIVGIDVHWFWVAVTALFAAERVGSVRKRGWRAMLIAATVFIEFLYDLFLQGVQATAFAHAVFNKEKEW